MPLKAILPGSIFIMIKKTIELFVRKERLYDSDKSTTSYLTWDGTGPERKTAALVQKNFSALKAKLERFNFQFMRIWLLTRSNDPKVRKPKLPTVFETFRRREPLRISKKSLNSINYIVWAFKRLQNDSWWAAPWLTWRSCCVFGVTIANFSAKPFDFSKKRLSTKATLLFKLTSATDPEVPG